MLPCVATEPLLPITFSLGVDVLTLSPAVPIALLCATPEAASALLLALAAGSSPSPSPDAPFNIRYAGLAAPALDLGLHVTHVGEDDPVERLATVREALAFAQRCAPRSCACGACAALTAPALLAALRLDRAADTLLRDASGGEKRRATLGEALLCPSRALLVNSPTSGLDAATALAVVAALCAAARGGARTLLCALQQPEGGLLAQFDGVLLVAPRGAVLFFGPVGALEARLAAWGAPRPRGVQLPEWALRCAAGRGGVATAALAEAWRAEGGAPAAGVAGAPAPPPPPLRHGCALPVALQLRVLSSRATRAACRDTNLLLSRGVSYTLMAVILATLFQSAPVAFAPARFGLTLFLCTFYAFGNQAALPELLAARHVLHRQIDRRLYGGCAAATALVAGALPLSLASLIVFTSITYWPLRWAPDFARYLVFCLVLFLLDLTMAGCACIAPTFARRPFNPPLLEPDPAGTFACLRLACARPKTRAPSPSSRCRSCCCLGGST
jgi:hypothetical protein